MFDAHDQAFALFSRHLQVGHPRQVKTAMEAVSVGNQRRSTFVFSRCAANTPSSRSPARRHGAGPAILRHWPEYQAENQICLLRERFFLPRLRVERLDASNVRQPG